MKKLIVLLSFVLILAGCELMTFDDILPVDYTIINATGRVFPCITVGEDTYANIPVYGSESGTAYGVNGGSVGISASIWEDSSGSLYMDDVGKLQIYDDRSYTITLSVVMPSVDTNAWRYSVRVTVDN